MAGPHNFIRIQPSGNLWAIRFDYDNNLVEAMREIGADWDAIRRVWVVADAARADVLSYANATSNTSSHFLSNVRAAKLKLLGVPELDMGRPLAPAGEALKPYQWEGVSFAAERPAILLADQPGLGKTNQAIGVMNAMQSWNKVLIVCPANMKMDWFLRMRGDPKYGQAGWLIDTTKTIGIAKGSYFPPTNIVIINHDITFRHKDKLREVTWDLIVVDECFVAGTKVATPDGDKSIDDIRVGDRVLNATGVGVVDSVFCRLVDCVYELEFSDGTVTRCTGNHPYFTDQSWRKAEEMELGRLTFRQQDVSRLWAGFQAEDQSGLERAGTGSIVEDMGSADYLRSELCKEAEKPDPFTGCPRKVIENASRYGTQAASEGWKREAAAIRSIQSSVRTWYGMGCGTLDTNQDASGERVSDVLQGGYSKPVADDCDRSGREQPLSTRASRAGQEEGCPSDQPRLVRVSRIELVCSSLVYNIGVTGHPSYFANGHLVHNCHFCKSTKAQRTIAICGGKRGRGNPPIRPLHGKRKMALSGTPLVNKPEEIWPICNWLDPKRWASENWFRERYSVYEEKCIGRKGKRIDPETGKPELKYVKSYAGAKNLEELNARLKGTIMLRRTKAEVLKDLPHKLRQVIEIDVPEASTAIGSERKALSGLSAETAKLRAAIMLARVSGNEDDYREAVAALEDFYKGKGEQVALLRKQVALEKLPYVIDHVRNLLLDPDVKVVVFAHHQEIVERIEGALKDFGAVKLYGGMDDVEKEGNKQRFQHDPTCRVFVASILAAGVGITLTASSNAVFAELDWVPANVTQAEDRLHRIGQRDSVLVQHIVAYGSLDAHIAKQLVRKQEVLDTVLDSGVAAQEPVDWLADHRGIPMDAELDNPVNQTPNAIAASQYGLKRLVDNPNEYHVTDSDLIVAQRLLEHQILVGRPAALARWLAKKYLEIQPPTA